MPAVVLAMARFSWAFALTQQAGMSLNPSLESSLKATGNGSFVAVTPMVTAMITGGEDLSDTLAETKLFPREYLELVRVGEATGTVPGDIATTKPAIGRSSSPQPCRDDCSVRMGDLGNGGDDHHLLHLPNRNDVRRRAQ